MGQRVPLTFFLPGFSKCGTTSFVEMLQRHPQILFPSRLEPWFFSADDYEARWDWYRSLFPADLSPYRAIGDDSTTYASYRNLDRTVDRLVTLYPDARFLFVVRDPAARLESSFREFHHSGPRFAVDAPFGLDEALKVLPALVKDSSFWSLISAYRSRVDEERIKVVHLEDLVDTPAAVVRDSFEFLGLAPMPEYRPGTAAHRNKRERKLQDTRLLRRMRHARGIGPTLSRMPAPTQDRYLSKIGLRRASAPVRWTPGALRILREEMLPDARMFAAHYGLPRRGWTKLEALTESRLVAAEAGR